MLSEEVMSGNEFADEQTAIEERFKTLWGATSPVKWENVNWSEPKAVTAWVALTIVTTEGNQIELRERALHRYGGIVIVQVFQKSNSGTKEARKLAGKVADIFRRASIQYGESGLLRFRTPAIAPQPPNNGWFQLNVNCPYIRDVYHTRPTS